jgi:primosomal protein N' (replication factor Y)
MSYAHVAVNCPSYSPFCYAIPAHLKVDVGQVIWVPFGPRTVQGIVVRLSEAPSVDVVKEIVDVATGYPLLSPTQIQLAQWISRHYLSPLFDAIALMLPPGFERKLATYLRLSGDQSSLPLLTPDQAHVFHFVEEKRRVSPKELERRFGISKARQITDRLVNLGLVVRFSELPKARVKPKVIPYIKLIASKDNITAEIAQLKKTRAYKQVALLQFLTEHPEPLPISEVRKRVSCSLKTVRVLEARHLFSVELVKVRRDPLSHFDIKPMSPPLLTPSQEVAWSIIEHNRGKAPVFLLLGVTGSGKTEIYLRTLAKIVAEGKRGICLVPEIALTAQTVERFASGFPGRVAVLHSALSLGEQFDEWQRIKEGECDVVIGPRSALFAPQPNLGLIIVDEEHEWTYKQEDKSPRYHARDVAVKLAKLSGATVILGSATPDVDSFHRARLGQYQLVELKERITPHGYSPLPEVTIVDLKEELKVGNTSMFSRSLLSAMREALVQGEQIILFLNRRGTATFIQCRRCGFVFRCPRCSIALTYHSMERKLVCHRCHYALPVPRNCPNCLGSRLRFLGIGTQRVEDEVKRFFPKATVLRWDRDVITKKYAHEELLRTFRERKADILIGTQMIAKGLDLPWVTLAGIINADTGLNFPDFRAGERTFQLLCQVAGRAGRGVKAGRVIVQTYSPENYAVRAAAKHDYVGFYNQEINYRQQYSYPPFSRFIRLVYTHTNDKLCQEEADRVSSLLLEKKQEEMPDWNLIGPIPAFASRVRGRYRWQIIIRGSNPAQALLNITLPQGWTVDVDPVGMV